MIEDFKSMIQKYKVLLQANLNTKILVYTSDEYYADLDRWGYDWERAYENLDEIASLVKENGISADDLCIHLFGETA